MTTQSAFYYPVTLNQDSDASQVLAPVVTALPLNATSAVCILLYDVGNTVQGLYVFDGEQFRFAMPMPDVSASIIYGNLLSVYSNKTDDVTAPTGSIVFKNGIQQPGENITHGNAIYSVRTPQAGGGSGSVISVNGQTGIVTINAGNLSGFANVAVSGSYTDLNNTPAPYALPVSSATVLGGVKVQLSSYITVDGSGNIDLAATLITAINSKLSNAVTSGSGTSLIKSLTAGVLTLKSLAAGANINLVDDGLGNLTIAATATPYTLPTASASVLGGVKVGSGLSIDGAGVLTATAQALTPATASVLGGVKVGTGLSVLGDGTLSTSIATASVLGAIKVGSGLSIAGDGTLSNNYILPTASSSMLGGVMIQAGSNISIDGSGNIDVKAALLTTINGKIDTVVASGGGSSVVRQRVGNDVTLNDLLAGANITITDNGVGGLVIAATGGTVPIASATVLGGIKVGSGLAIDGSGVLSATAGSTTLTGDITGSGTGSIATTLASTGVTAGTYTKVTVDVKGRVTVGANLASGDVTTALGFTPYNSTNPSGYIASSFNASVSGDVTGSGPLSAAIPLTLAASGVTAGTYTKVTVDVKGRVTVGAALSATDVNTALGYTAYNGAANPSGFITTNQAITVSGDATGSGTTTIALTLANSGVAAGTYTKVTVDAKGRVTVGANPTTLAGYGITDALNAGTGGSVAGNITMTSGATITGLPNPVSGSDAANRAYVDASIASVVSGTSWRANAMVTTTANIALTGLQTIDGYTTLSGDRVLVKDQTDPTENGVYVAAAGAWVRGIDTDTGAEILGMAILVLNGTVNQFTQWVNTNTGSITIGTDAINYTKLQGEGVLYSAGTGLALTGNTFSIANTGVTTGTYAKVTVNAQGQVTAGAALASGDVTTALGFTPYNSTNPSGYISANQNITYAGDATGSGTTAVTLTLAASGVAAGTYTKVTVDAKGRVTVGANPTTLAGYGITDALSNAGGNVSGNITMTSGAKVTGLPTPTLGSDASTKTYTDVGDLATANAVAWKTVVAAATTANITLSGAQTIDGYAAVAGDRVLVKAQTNAFDNGIYVVAAGAWARAADSAVSATIVQQVVMVLNGTVNQRTIWLNTNTGVITIGTTNVTYASASSGASATTLTGDVTGSGTGTVATTLAASGVTAGTYTKVTVDAKGRVTVGAALASGDITTALGYTPYNGSTNPNNYISANQTITLSGDVTGSGTTAITATLGNSGVTAGTYTKVTVDVKGRVTVGAALASSDVTTALTYTPVNKAGDTMTGTFNQAPTVNVSSAATALVGSATGNDINMLGTTTITAFDNAPVGSVRTIKFAGILTLTHNGSTLVLLNNGANITTAAGDSAQFTSTGASAWRMDYYQRSNGQSLVGAPDATKLPLTGGTLSGTLNLAPGVSLPSAATLNIGAATANSIFVTGTTAITAFDTVASGAERTLLFQGAMILTQNPISLILPTAANITTALGDVAKFVSLGGGNWQCTEYMRQNGQALVATPDATKLPLAGGSLTGAVNEAATVPIVAAATTPIGSTPSNNISITTNTTITAFDTIAAGATRTVFFFGTPLLTHNATSLILPTAANIQTVAGDTAEFLSLGSGNWRCLWYQRTSGQSLVGAPDATKLPLAGGTMSGAINGAPPVTLASAATVNIGAAAANDITVSGTTTVTAFDTIAAGAVRKLTFSGALTLTHNATSLILPTGANITTGAGDVAQFTSLGAGNWRCDFYTKAGSAFATLTGTETLTNKTLTNAQITGFIESGATGTGASFTPDFTTGTDFEYTTNANTTITLPAAAAGRSYTITVVYGGAHTITFAGGTAIKYAGGTAPTATSVTGKTDIYVCKCNRAGNTTFVSDGGRNF